jgi:hypothetical protein
MPSASVAGASFVTCGVASHVSVAVAVPIPVLGYPAGDVHSKAPPAGAVIAGAVVSRTVTSCDAVPRFDAASRPLQVTVVLPPAKSGGASFVTGRSPSHRSDAVAVPSTTLVPVGDAHSVTTAPGASTSGFNVSATCSETLQELWFPSRSVASHCDVVVPMPSTVPGGTEQDDAGDGSQLSAALNA